MSQNRKRLVLSVIFLTVVTCVTSAALITRASLASSPPLTQVSKPTIGGSGNRFLQPEALHVSHRLGKRFDSSARVTSITATLTFNGSAQSVTITRRQAPTGEKLEIRLTDRLLTWTADEGTKTTSGVATDEDRLLIKRLAYDSPDHFVLAQLRGASYFTVARNVRPSNAADNYSGPLFNVVRVDDPQTDEMSPPQSSWRLYYINSQTGLIDRIVSQIGEQTVETTISAWSEVSGEKIPSLVTWSSNGRVVMSYQLSSVSPNE